MGDLRWMLKHLKKWYKDDSSNSTMAALQLMNQTGMVQICQDEEYKGQFKCHEDRAGLQVVLELCNLSKSPYPRRTIFHDVGQNTTFWCDIGQHRPPNDYIWSGLFPQRCMHGCAPQATDFTTCLTQGRNPQFNTPLPLERIWMSRKSMDSDMNMGGSVFHQNINCHGQIHLFLFCLVVYHHKCCSKLFIYLYFNA